MKTGYVVPLILLAAVAGFFANQYWHNDSEISFPEMDLGLVNPIQPGQDDCLPATDAPASVIEYFQRFNKPLPERFCAKEAALQGSHQPPQDSSQAEEAPDQNGGNDGPADGSFGYQDDQEGAWEFTVPRRKPFQGGQD